MTELSFGDTFYLESKEFRGKHFVVLGVLEEYRFTEHGQERVNEPRRIKCSDTNRNQYTFVDHGNEWLLEQPNSALWLYVDKEEVRVTGRRERVNTND